MLKEPAREVPTQIQRHASARTSVVYRRLLSGVAAIALMYGLVEGNYAWSTSTDPFATAGRPAAEANVAIPDFVPIVEAAKPAVVSIRVKSRVKTTPQVDPFEGTPFEPFFRQFGAPNNGSGHNPQPHFQRAQGSGFFISPDGFIVTNNHVVDGAVTVQVVMDDGTQLAAKVVGTDKRTDLALLKVDGRSDLPFVKLAASSPKIGSWVVAMGNPFGLGGTVTVGIVSAKGRDIGNGPYDDYIQIDAPVNRGNSGGPSFDMHGNVIGVNTAIFSPSGGSVGIAFDIPAETVKSVITQLAKTGHVERGWLGVEIQPVTKAIADSLGLKSASGALVAESQTGSPAETAGLKSGDIITAVNGREIKDARELARMIADSAPHSEVTLSVWREGKLRDVKVGLGKYEEKPATATAATAPASDNRISRLGITIAPAASVEGAGGDGLAVLNVDPDGSAAEAGLRAGDVILKAGERKVSSLGDLRQALEDARGSGKKHTLALVRRDTNERYVALDVPTG